MIGWNGTNYFTEIINIFGWTFSFLFQVPLFQWGQGTITIGSLILYGSIVYAILRFAINIGGSGITTERRIRIKQDE